MPKLDQLLAVLDQYPRLAIAVSGGVDSMLLMHVAHKYSTTQALAMHACSPAVPQQAFHLLSSYAARFSWDLQCLDAGEMRDENYRSNPQNRCYFCKSNLFSRIADEISGRRDALDFSIASGTNLDDLSDYRPGLKAASEFSVLQPYVDAQFSKADIYSLAKQLGLIDLQDLPAQPCLASRIETGIAVAQQDLHFIDRIESQLKDQLGKHETVRCRITREGVVLEFGVLPGPALLQEIESQVRSACLTSNKHYYGARNYTKGSAFLLGASV